MPADDEEIGVIIFTGAGDKSFCSGGTMQAISERTAASSAATCAC